MRKRLNDSPIDDFNDEMENKKKKINDTIDDIIYLVNHSEYKWARYKMNDLVNIIADMKYLLSDVREYL